MCPAKISATLRKPLSGLERTTAKNKSARNVKWRLKGSGNIKLFIRDSFQDIIQEGRKLHIAVVYDFLGDHELFFPLHTSYWQMPDAYTGLLKYYYTSIL